MSSPRAQAVAAEVVFPISSWNIKKNLTKTSMQARPHHGVDYVEFTAPDLAAVEAFYSAAFGWRFTARSDGYIAFSGPGLGGGFEQGPARPGGALVTLYTRDLEATLDSVQCAGGHICKGIFAFPLSLIHI